MFFTYYKKIKGYISTSPLTVILLLISICISSICIITVLILSGNIINGIILEEEISSLKKLFLIIDGLFIVIALLQQYEFYNVTKIIENTINNIKIKLFTSIESFQESYFRNSSTKNLLYMFIKDIEELRNVLTNNNISYIRSITQLIIISIIMFGFNVKLTFATLFLAPFVAILFIYLHRKKYILKDKEKNDNVAYTQFIEDTLLNLKTIKANGLDKQTRLDFHNINIENYKIVKSSRYLSSMLRTMLIGINFIVVSLVLISGSTLIISNELSIGRLVTFLLFIPLIYNSIFTVIKNYYDLSYHNKIINKILTTISTNVKNSNSKSDKNGEFLPGDIDFNNVTFKINGKEKIRNLNLYIKMGSKVILLGDESSCKEYISDLLEGGNFDYTGEIRINNLSYKDIKEKSIKSKVGKLTKNPIIFSGTIFDNLIYSNKNLTKEQVELVCRQVNIYDAIMALPNGFDTEIAPGSLLLNKGEFILLNIARLILKNPDIIILEEGNYNLASAMEGNIKASIDLLCKNKTVVIVTTKLNPNTATNNIFIIKNGEIVDEGNYNTLSSKPSNKDVFN